MPFFIVFIADGIPVFIGKAGQEIVFIGIFQGVSCRGHDLADLTVIAGRDLINLSGRRGDLFQLHIIRIGELRAQVLFIGDGGKKPVSVESSLFFAVLIFDDILFVLRILCRNRR